MIPKWHNYFQMKKLQFFVKSRITSDANTQEIIIFFADLFTNKSRLHERNREAGPYRTPPPPPPDSEAPVYNLKASSVMNFKAIIFNSSNFFVSLALLSVNVT